MIFIKRLTDIARRLWLPGILTALLIVNLYAVLSLHRHLNEIENDIATNMHPWRDAETIGGAVTDLLDRTERLETKIDHIVPAVDAALDDLRYR